MFDPGPLTPRRRSKMRAVISDYDLSRRGLLRRMVESDPAYDVVAETGSGDECAGVLARELPELAICSTACAPALAGMQPALPVMITIAGGPVASERVVCDVAVPLREAEMAEALALAASRILQIKVEDLSTLLGAYLAHGENAGSPVKQIDVADQNGEPRSLSTDDLLWIKAAGNYVQLYTTAGIFEMRETISNLAARLKPSGFRRIHRCVVVNNRAIRERNLQDGRLTSVVLDDGTHLLVGPNFRQHPPLEGEELGA
ncbi:MAG: LytTR family transcriptional regulator DNA-binding domain-containing protein [Acidobacteriia bacterium]|nr:LytTR family transcriptional regulator DNA-binding domain-containing protein [Terriglobia bacterium]